MLTDTVCDLLLRVAQHLAVLKSLMKKIELQTEQYVKNMLHETLLAGLLCAILCCINSVKPNLAISYVLGSSVQLQHTFCRTNTLLNINQPDVPANRLYMR